ncbi:MAG: ATP-binding protein [Pseudomonadota bacterium]
MNKNLVLIGACAPGMWWQESCVPLKMENSIPCTTSIRVTVAAHADALHIGVEDDGPGIAADSAAQVLERGGRLDEATPGHGIGLVMVQDIVHAHDGELHSGCSALGGLRCR